MSLLEHGLGHVCRSLDVNFEMEDGTELEMKVEVQVEIELESGA